MERKQIRREIALYVMALETERGHMKWRISELARRAKVSRPLVYYHFGRSKKEMLLNALTVVTEEYYALSGPRRSLAKNGKLLESIQHTRGMLEKNPALAVFYQRWRFMDSEISRQFKSIEIRYRKKLAEAFPHLSAEQILFLHVQLHGVVTAPFLSQTEVKSFASLLIREYGLA